MGVFKWLFNKLFYYIVYIWFVLILKYILDGEVLIIFISIVFYCLGWNFGSRCYCWFDGRKWGK